MTAPGETFGPYELVERLGQGGMATVWAARKRREVGFERVVCVKRIRADQRAEDDAAQRFLREARLLGRLHHPSVAQIYDAGEIDGEYYIEMEYLRGKDLRTLMKAQLEVGPPPLGLGITVATTVGRALDHAHQLVGLDGRPEPVIHRDVTAANIMLCFDGAVKLVDFGLAKAVGGLHPKLTGTGVLVGTIGYIAPEVQRGAAASAASDQFSLGVIFYETLTGRRLLDPIVARERPPSKCDEHVPQALDAICLRAIADKPEERYPSCGAFVEAIEAAVPNLALSTQGVADLLTERFGAGRPVAASSSPQPAPPQSAPPQSAPPPSTTFTDHDAPTLIVPARKRKRRRPAPPQSDAVTYALALAIILVAVAGALSFRHWRTHRDEEVPSPAPAPAGPAPKVRPPEPREVDLPVEEPPPRSQPVRRPDGKGAKKKHRHSRHDDDMQMFQPSF